MPLKNYSRWIASSILISILSIAVFLILTLDSNTASITREIRPGIILLALCIHMLSFVVWGMRTRSMASALGYKIGFLTSLEIVISSTFVAAITPSSIGGEPLRIHLLNQNNMPVGSASAVVLGERLMDAVLILLAAPFSVHMFRVLLSNSKLDFVLMSGEVLLILCFSLFLYAVMKPQKMKFGVKALTYRLAHLLGKKAGFRVSKLSSSIDKGLEEFRESIGVFFKEGKKGLFYGILYTVIFWVVEFSMLFVILLGFNQFPPIKLVFAAQVLIIMIVVMPLTPGSSGVAEAAAMTLFSAFVPASILGITVAAWRAFTFYVNLLLGGFVSFKLLKDTEWIHKYLK